MLCLVSQPVGTAQKRPLPLLMVLYRFYQHYSPLLPGIFDPSISADEMYSQSPLLFWSIVCTGARKYSSDPTILEQLAKPVIELAFSSMASMKQTVLAIQAALILCSWPTPASTVYKDPSHALAGAALQLALQNGLHAGCHERDFARRPIHRQRIPKSPIGSPNDPQKLAFDPDIAFRACLWIHCLITFQRLGWPVGNVARKVTLTRVSSTSLCDGLPFSSIPQSATYEQDFDVYNSLPPSLAPRYMIHRILTDAITAIRRDIKLEDTEMGPSLNSLIQMFDVQLQKMTLAAQDATGKWHPCLPLHTLSMTTGELVHRQATDTF